MYPREQIRAISQKTDLISLVGQYVSLKKKGKTYSGLCPFHSEKTPSFHVDSLKGFYHCFGCGAHGDAIKFLIENGNLTFLEAVEKLAALQGINLGKEKKIFHPTRKFLEEAQSFFTKQWKKLIDSSPPKKYLVQRNFKNQTLEKFEIGYSPESWDALLKNFNTQSLIGLEKAGLVKKSEKKGNYYDFFRGRIMFPFRDYQGGLVGFAGRSVSEDNIPKYLNSPDIELFQKNSFFYGLFQAKEAIIKKKRTIVVEGYTDVLRMHEAGFAETLAVAGTALTQKHIEKLKQNFGEIIFLFDADDAGISASMRAARLAIEYGVEAKISFLPLGKDPDEFLREYPSSEMEKILENATSVLFSILEHEKKKYEKTKDISSKDVILKDLLELAARLIGGNKQKIFLNEVASYFKIDLNALQKQTQQKQIDYKKTEQSRLERQKNLVPCEIYVAGDDNLSIDSSPSFFKVEQRIDKNTKNKKEEKIVGLVLRNPKYFPTLRKYLQYQDFSKEPLQRLMERLFSMQNEEIASCSLADFLQFFCDDKEIVREILFCIKILPENLSEIFWLEKWIYELKKEVIYQRFSKESLYLSTEKQKEQWQLYKLQLEDMKHLSQNLKHKRVFFKSNLNS